MPVTTVADFTKILGDIGVTVTYYVATRVIDPIYGSETVTLDAGTSKTWVFRKKASDIELKKWGVADIGTSYIMTPVADTINYGDRIVFSGETYEYTPDCKSNEVRVGGVYMANYYSLLKVAG